MTVSLILVIILILVLKKMNLILSDENKYKLRMFASKKRTFPFDKRNLPAIPLTIGGVVYYFIIDTGSESSIISHSAADILCDAGTLYAPKQSESIIGVNSKTTDIYYLKLPFTFDGTSYEETFKILPIDSAMEVCTKKVKAPVLGLLGLDFYMRHRISIDFEKGVIWTNEISGNKGTETL